MPNGMLGDNTVLREILSGPLTTLLERLNGHEGREWKTALDQFLRKENPWVEKRNLFKRLDLLTIPSYRNFAVKTHFKSDMSPDAPVKIRRISSMFLERFGDFVEDFDDWELRVSELCFAIRGTPLYREMMEHDEKPVDLYQMWHLLTLQGRAQVGGRLLVNNDFVKGGKENIFLVQDPGQSNWCWFVVLWNPPSLDCWDIIMRPTTYSDRFRSGSLLFSQ